MKGGGSHSDLGEFWRSVKMWGSNQMGAEPSRRPCPLGGGGGVVRTAHPRGKTDRPSHAGLA